MKIATMRQIIHQVDAFTDRPFAGNPAGVCLLPEPAAEAWMQGERVLLGGQAVTVLVGELLAG